MEMLMQCKGQLVTCEVGAAEKQAGIPVYPGVVRSSPVHHTLTVTSTPSGSMQ